MDDASDMRMNSHDETHRNEEHDQVGTVEVQILLSWFFETSTPSELAIDVPRAA